MKKQEYLLCPFCKKLPQLNESVPPSEEDNYLQNKKVYSVRCVTTECPAADVTITDMSWNRKAFSKPMLREEILKTLKTEGDLRYGEKRRAFALYAMSN